MTRKSEQDNEFIIPNWQAPKNIKAATSTKIGGVSKGAYTAFNLSDYVGDLYEHVAKNRELLVSKLNLPSSPLWLKQIHGNKVIHHSEFVTNIEADAIISDKKNVVCCIQTADCLPILLGHKNKNIIAAIHAGWKGLYNGIIENTVHKMECNTKEIIAWIGPSISQKAYQVSSQLYQQFIDLEKDYSGYFIKTTNNFYNADLKSIAKHQLNKLGVTNITIANYCTYTDNQYFYSYRRNNVTGRQATLIWIT